MATGNWHSTDLHRLFGLVQSSMVIFPKELIISKLRDYFKQDSFYHFVSDEWGYPKTLDHTDLPLGTGNLDEEMTRIFIGENFRQDVQFYPAIFVKNTGMRYVPISANREYGKYTISSRVYNDGYGNTKKVFIPKAYRFEGASEGSLSIDVVTRSLVTRDQLSELVYMLFVDIAFDDLRHAGLVVKGINISGTSEQDDRNGKLYKASLTLDIRMEWAREIQIENYIERILFNILIGDAPVESELTITTDVSIVDLLLD